MGWGRGHKLFPLIGSLRRGSSYRVTTIREHVLPCQRLICFWKSFACSSLGGAVVTTLRRWSLMDIYATRKTGRCFPVCPDLVLMQGVQIWGQSLILLLHDRRD